MSDARVIRFPENMQNARYADELELTAGDMAEIEALQRLADVELERHPARMAK